MSAFFDQLEAYLDATRASDRRLNVAVTIEIGFLSQTVRLWGGRGRMITPDGNAWTGFVGGADGQQVFIEVPETEDPRSGNAPLYEMRLGYLDTESYSRLRDDEEEIDGRLIRIGYVYMPDETGTRALTDPGGVERFRMVGGASFSERRTKMPDGSHRLQYSVACRFKNFNGGRSRLSFGTFTGTSQKFRSDVLFGVLNDRYADFVPKYAGGYKITL
ncbi:hypothetical protein [Oceaniradius stylonematis]|uniref:hypothetical protein n=1 Tax=Oceaniradius stylonematis TaxID=2184161 RepID=UPI003B5A6B33